MCEEKGDKVEGFLDSAKLKAHMRSHHPEKLREIEKENQIKIEKENQIKCPKCKKRFRTETEVETHLIKIHNT